MTYITEYFPKDVLQSVEKGRFRFGTLASYGSGQLAGARFSDRREGSGSLFGQPSNTDYQQVDRLELPGILFTNLVIRNSTRVIEIESTFNELIFCATLGLYNIHHHRIMRDGLYENGKLHYLGNAELSHYAVIDIQKFSDAIKECSLKTDGWKSGSITSENFLVSEVEYGDRDQDFKIEFGYNYRSDPKFDHFKRVVFTKPESFSIEKEIRVVLRPNYPHALPSNADAKFFESSELRAAIIEIGCL
jgi:hypothetical protein